MGRCPRRWRADRRTAGQPEVLSPDEPLLSARRSEHRGSATGRRVEHGRQHHPDREEWYARGHPSSRRAGSPAAAGCAVRQPAPGAGGMDQPGRTSPADARRGDPGSQRATGDRRDAGGNRRWLDKPLEGRRPPLREAVTVCFSCLDRRLRRLQRTPCCRLGTGIQAEHRRLAPSAEPDACSPTFSRHGGDRDCARPGCHGSGPARLRRGGLPDLEPSADSARSAW